MLVGDADAAGDDAFCDDAALLLSPDGDAVLGVAFSPCGKRVLTGSGDKKARIFEVFESLAKVEAEAAALLFDDFQRVGTAPLCVVRLNFVGKGRAGKTFRCTVRPVKLGGVM